MGEHKISKRERIFNLTKGKCIYCGCDLDIDNFHIDHIVPKAKGGKDKDNIFPSCQDCNLSKGSLSVEEFRTKIKKTVTETHTGRMVAKFFPVDQKHKVTFWFENIDSDEETEYGDLQKHIHNILDGQ